MRHTRLLPTYHRAADGQLVALPRGDQQDGEAWAAYEVSMRAHGGHHPATDPALRRSHPVLPADTYTR